jgi:hypothetical protein
MDWVLEHLQIIILAAVAVAAALQKFKQSRAQAGAEPPPAADQDEAERTRRIQEEIRRRILERRGLAPVPPALTEEEERPFPEAPPMVEEVRPVVVAPPVLVPLAPAPAPAPFDSVEADRQLRMMERLRELERTAVPSAFGVPALAAPGAAPVSTPASGLLALLRQPGGLRQAVVLREIMDAPPGLRPPATPGQGIWTRM